MADVRYCHPVDRYGERVHLAFGALWCFMVAGPQITVEAGSIPLAVIFLIRLPFLGRSLRTLLVQPLTLWLLAWIILQFVSLLWTRSTRDGLDAIDTLRFLACVPFLWPVIHRRGTLIGAMALGFLCGNLSQLAMQVGDWTGTEWLIHRGHFRNDRNGGWWPAVSGGEILIAALGLHLPAALMGPTGTKRERVLRVIATAGCIVTLLGIFASGTRGAWVGALGLIAIGCVVAVVRLPDWRSRGRALGLVAGVVVIAGAVAGVLIGDSLVRRFESARAEVARAMADDYDSDNGARVMMARWAAEAFAQHPVIGNGAGSFRTFVREDVGREGSEGAARERFLRENHGHSHNAVLEVGATTGLVGLALALVVIATALYGAFATLLPGELGGYAAGPGFALIGLLLLTPFDALQSNSRTGAVLAVLLALCPAWRARKKVGTRKWEVGSQNVEVGTEG